MSFTEPSFLLYLAGCVCVFRVCPQRLRATFLLLASYAFYLTWSLPGAVLLASLTALTFLAAVFIERAELRRMSYLGWLGPAVAIILVSCLVAFKIALLTPARGIAGLVMPLGISYYTFKLTSYVIEVYRGTLPAERNLVNFASYVAFFPQMVAGPIQRPGDFFSQLPPERGTVVGGTARIAWGIAKKLMIADNLAPTVNYIYANVYGLHGAPLWLGFYLFPLQLYADFSALTDIAIGAGQLFGITGPENFNRPFTASTISDFWRRWHMSLTTWLGDYVFLPLRMATRQTGPIGLVASITINMIAIGLWHGLTATYLVFGVLNAAYLVTDALTSRSRARSFKMDGWFGWFLTFHLIMIAEVFFRASRVSDALWLLGHLWVGLFRSAALLRNVLALNGVRFLAIGLSGYVILELCERYRPDLKIRELYAAGPRWLRWSFYSAGLVIGIFGFALLVATTGEKKAAFIYEIF